MSSRIGRPSPDFPYADSSFMVSSITRSQNLLVCSLPHERRPDAMEILDHGR